MTYSFILFQYWLVSLAVFIGTAGITTLVQEELGHVEVLLFTSDAIQLSQCHFGNLVTRYTYYLSFTFTNFAAYTVCITDSDIQEVTLAGSLVVSDSTFYHVAEVIEFVAQVFYQFPTLGTCPFVWLLGVHGTAGVQVTVRFLSGSNNYQHAVDVLHQLLVGISLQQIAGPLDGFVNISIIERVSAYHIIITWIGSFYKVFVTSSLFTFTECKRDGYFTACLETLSPESICYFYRCKWYRVVRIPM